MFFLRKPRCRRMIESLSARRYHDAPSLSIDCAQTVENGLGHHHHPSAPAKRFIIAAPACIPCKISEIMNLDLNAPTLFGLLRHRLIERTFKKLWEKGDDIDFHNMIFTSGFSASSRDFGPYRSSGRHGKANNRSALISNELFPDSAWDHKIRLLR